MNGEKTARTRLDEVRARLDRAASAAGRPPADVLLLAVGKTFAAEAIRALAEAGQNAFGENYLQEALAKQQALADLALEWHFIGPIQSNKTRPIAESFDWVHTVDREKIAARLSAQRPAGLPPLQVCIEVNVDDEASKHGCSPADAPALALAVAALPGLTLRGLMAIPAPGPTPADSAPAFARLAALADSIRGQLPASQAACFDTLSMGMSADLEVAIGAGATIVRVGTALFGQRSQAATN
ncbi:MAG: YggS family pyridoxal phosphate-dependent enzyme [Burkholderiaceae bacterium]